MKIHRFHHGFTFLEFICVLAILGILYFMAMPFTNAWNSKNQLETLAHEITTAIHYARNAALYSDHRLALAPAYSSLDWSKGMILFVDNKKHQYDHQKDHLLYEWKWDQQSITITWKGFQSNRYLLFSEDLKHAAMSGHFELVDHTGHQTKLIINRIGRVTSS